LKSPVASWQRSWAGLRYRLQEASWSRSLRWRPRKPESELERNIHYLYVEIFWAAIYSAVLAFNVTYALRLGATNQMVGWLSSLPSLFAMVMMVPAARFLESRGKPMSWMLGSLLSARLGLLTAALIPWLFPRYAAPLLVGLFVLRTVPITFFSTGFSPLLADIIPERERSRVFANRSIIVSGTTAVVTFVAGKWLDAALHWEWAAFPLNYQLLYVIGGITALLSTYYVSKIRAPQKRQVVAAAKAPPSEAPPSEAPPSEAPHPQEATTRWTVKRLRETGRTMLTEHRDFSIIIANTLFFNLGAWMVGPLYAIFLVNQLNASDGWIGLNSTLANLGVIVGYALWRRWVPRLGDNRALRLTVPFSACYAFLVAFFPNLNLILVWGVVINLINSGVNLSHTNVFYRACPEERRASYMAFYSSVMNAGAFVCPMIGIALSGIMDIRWVLVIGGVVRLLGGLMFHVWRIEDEPAFGSLQPLTTV
jgi:MFS family permease